MAKVDEARLEAIIAQQIDLAKTHDKNERADDRAKALEYFFGDVDKYIPPETNRSRVVSRDVADTMGWMLPGIMRVFTASDRMAIAEPVESADLQFASQATDGLNYVFWKENKGYETVYYATWDALVTGNGITKTYYDDTPIYSTSFHSGLTEEQMAMLLMADDDGNEPEVLAQSENIEYQQDEQTGQAMPVTVYDLKIKRKSKDGRFVVEAIPPEKFLIDADAISTDDAAFTAHWDRKTRSALVEMGYSKAIVAEIPEAAKNQTSEEAARQDINDNDDADASMQLVDYYECFVRIDVDDDGEAELVRACYAGGANGKLLDWEVWEDEHPFDDIPCEPVPHRWSARSIADETMDVQDIKTVLLRQGLNNVYASNNPQRFVTGDIQNKEELLNPTFGGTVFGKAGSTVQDLTVPFVAQSAFEAIAYQDEVIQRRTGVGRGTMALDPQALQNQTAEAVREGKDAGYSQIELVARNMAEWGWKKAFRKLLRLMIKHQSGPRAFIFNNREIKIDPRFWNSDMDVTINVGLGTGSRDRDLAMLSKILETQVMMADRFMASGAADEAIDMLPRILQTLVKMAESAGIKNPEDYYPDYTAEKVQKLKQFAAQKAQEGDPKVQAEMQKAMAQLKLEQEKSAGQIQLEREKMAMESELKREQLVAEMNLKREQLAAELQLKREISEQEMKLKAHLGIVGAQAKVSSSQVRMGGEPG